MFSEKRWLSIIDSLSDIAFSKERGGGSGRNIVYILLDRTFLWKLREKHDRTSVTFYEILFETVLPRFFQIRPVSSLGSVDWTAAENEDFVIKVLMSRVRHTVGKHHFNVEWIRLILIFFLSTTSVTFYEIHFESLKNLRFLLPGSRWLVSCREWWPCH